MNIALMAHDKKTELLVQFCVAYGGTLVHHKLCVPATTGKLICNATGLSVTQFLPYDQGGIKHIASYIECKTIDMVVFFSEPSDLIKSKDVNYLTRICDKHNIPIATNIATAEVLIKGLKQGAWTGYISHLPYI